MRDALAALEGKRIVVQASYRNAGPPPLSVGGRGKWLLFLGVGTLDGDLLADHLWMPNYRAIAALSLGRGMAVEMAGTVGRYRRADGSEDFNLRNVRRAR